MQVQGDHDSSEPLEFGNIEVGLKMSSYTISNLEPSKTYKETISTTMARRMLNLLFCILLPMQNC